MFNLTKAHNKRDKMKILLVLIFIFCINFNLYANCNKAYKKNSTIRAIAAPVISSSSYAQGVGNIMLSYSPSIAALVGTFNPSTGYAFFGAHFASMALYPIMGGVSSTIAYNRLKTYKLLQESQIGLGKQLSNLADEFSEELGQDIDEAMIADIINTANENNIFCKKDQPLFSRNQILEFLKEELKQ